MAERIRGLIGPAGKYNLHTHSVYCDGKDKPEDMVKRALELDFSFWDFPDTALRLMTWTAA
jgi:histidinol phosphatase-like PHP family hydrolase